MKLSLRALSLFVLVICFFSDAFAQSSTQAPLFALRTDLIPPSPNAAALGKYGVVPVSLQTGIPNISIPITEAVGQQLKIPVTLNYNTSGFKPTEEASWVGLGWSLEAGGVITRIVKDKVDEFMADDGKYANVNWRFTTQDSITNSFLDSALYFASKDTEPDIYAFNFSGYSGKFVIYRGKIFQYPYQQLTISGDPSTGFIIITPDGNQYNFPITETTLALTNHIHNNDDVYYYLPSQYPTSWYLQSIVSPDNKDNITFSYSSADTIVQNGPGTQDLKKLITTGVPVYSPNPVSFPFPVRIYTPRLTRITTSKMYINFNSSTTARQDIATSYALANIEIYNYQGQLLNRFTFDTDYFPASSSNTTGDKWLKLTGLDEGISAQNIKKTKFFYNESGSYPSKTLPSVDDWGYSNGGTLSEVGSLIPKTLYPVYGVDKTPNFPSALNTVIRQIIYPTGGSTLFTYEPNLTNNGLNYVTTAKTAEVDMLRQPDTTTTNNLINTGSFALNVAQTVHIVTIRRPKDGATSGATKDFTPQLIITSGTQSYSYTIADNAYNNGKVDSLMLQPGTYNMEVQCDSKENYAEAMVNYVYQTDHVIEGVPGPGIRIKQITDYLDPEATKVASVKQYIYKDSIGESTGLLLNHPNYGGKNYVDTDYSVAYQPPKISNYLNYTATNGSGMIVSQDMYYTKVYERDVSPTDTLLSMSTFNLFDTNIQNGTNVFLTSQTDYRQSGNNYIKVKKQNYHYSIITDSAFFAIRPYLSAKNIPGATLATGVPTNRLRFYGYDIYTVEPSWLYLIGSTNVNYYNASDSVVTTTSYLYDAIPRNKIMVTTTDSKGRSTVEKYKYRESYVTNDFSPLVFTPGVNSVVEKQEWLKRGPTDSVLMSGIITQYDPTFYKPKTLYGFENVTQVSSLNQETVNSGGQYTALLSDTRYKPRITNTFDATTGNLNAQDHTNFSSGTVHEVAYLWGYHNNYPIAQVKNANLAAVAYTSFEDDDNSWTYTATNVVTTDARTGVKCYSGTISKSALPTGNYSVSLWAKGSGTITVGGVAKTITANWAWYEWQLTNITSVTINSNGNLVDEVRLLPANALMTTYTYLPGAGVSSITDTKGITQFYDYDEMERLLDIKDKDGNILKKFDYNYAVQGPNWTDTGVTQCVQSNGANTGEQQMQQIDTNPLSATYNQNQWRSLGNTGNCPVPVPTYIVMTVAGASTATVNGNTHTFNTFSFKAYADANSTTLLTLSAPLTINYLITSTETFNDGSANSVNTTTGTVTIAAGTNNVTSPSIDISGCNGSGTKGNCVTSTVTLQPGTGYIVSGPQD
jgi:hypothetical protein